MNILEDFTFSYGIMDKEYFLDEPIDAPHYHGIIKYIGQKIK